MGPQLVLPAVETQAPATAPARVLIADPPWGFRDALPGGARGAKGHYAVMTAAQICAYPLPPLEKDCVLFLWRVAAMAPEAFAVCAAWGFRPKAEIVWVKKTKHGKAHCGMGRYTRGAHESCILATRGCYLKPKALNVRSVFEAPVGRHSEKPDAFYHLVESLYDGPRVELFARRERPGWSCYGTGLPLGREPGAARG